MTSYCNEPEKLRRKRIVQVQIASLVGLGISFAHHLYLLSINNLVFVGISIFMLILVGPMVKRNKLDFAANLLVCSLTVLMLGLMWSNEGNRDEILLVFPAIVCFGVLIGAEGLLKYLLALMMINIILIAAAFELGWREFSPSTNSYLSAIVILTILPIIFYVVRLISNDLKDANQEILDQQQHLEEKVKERTRELESSVNDLVEARSQLAESEKMASLGRMVAGLSHEINTPIGIAVTAATHLQQSNDELRYSLEDGAIRKSQLVDLLNNNVESARLLNTNLQRASDLISDFKNTSVVQSDERKSQFSLNGHIDRILETLKPKLIDTDVEVQFNKSEDVRVLQDPQALAQVITNLFINSLKHGFNEGKSKGQISISTERDEDTLKLIFEDNGSGADEKTLEHMFEPFYTTKRGEGGTGLGMHIVHNLVTHALKGTINCTSTINKGIRFEIAFDFVKQ